MSAPERRAHRRREFAGNAYWSAGRLEGRCSLYNISLGGALIERPNVLLLTGKELALTIDLGNGALPTVRATVVLAGDERVAFRFDDPTKEFAEALQRAIRLLERW